jgi:uncharacterized protein (UPF0212 family)
MRADTERYRTIWIDAYGDLPHPCYWCREPVTFWSGRAKLGGIVHHLDEDHSNNVLSNLAVGHHACHSRYHGATNTMTPEGRARQAERLRAKTPCPDCGVEFNDAWMARHVRLGRCVNPTVEQIAAGEAERAERAERARRQMTGKTWTAESRAKLSATNTGRTWSEDERARRAASGKRTGPPDGFKHSAEAKLAISRAASKRTICPDCGRAFTPAWINRHKAEGRCHD